MLKTFSLLFELLTDQFTLGLIGVKTIESCRVCMFEFHGGKCNMILRNNNNFTCLCLFSIKIQYHRKLLRSLKYIIDLLGSDLFTAACNNISLDW